MVEPLDEGVLEVINGQSNYLTCSQCDHVNRLSVVDHHVGDGLIPKGPRDIDGSVVAFDVCAFLLVGERDSS